MMPELAIAYCLTQYITDHEIALQIVTDAYAMEMAGATDIIDATLILLGQRLPEKLAIKISNEILERIDT